MPPQNLTPESRQAEAKLRGQSKLLLERLRAEGDATLAELSKAFSTARAASRRLADSGLVRLSREQDVGDEFFATPVERDTPPKLNAPQQAAVDAIVGQLTSGKGAAFLLQGVTASGKTEVYLHAVTHALALGGTALVLLPEIALTPQIVARFRARLGDRIAVLHSGLTNRERHLMWRKLRGGQLSVAIGARSALFAPLERLSLICVDEEHDASFKQEEGVRYHARDMALLRAHRANAVCVLGSATPSLGTLSLVHQGRMERLLLPGRAHAQAMLPEIEMVDLRRTGPGPTGDRLISLQLFRALERTLEHGEQAILFLNRRGFAPSLVCESCGSIAECPHCSVPLTVHRAGRVGLQCHHCDFRRALPGHCPQCNASRWTEEGTGTERLEQTLATLLPRARIARLDRDVAAGLKSAATLQRMQKGELDVLVGTQMVTKGHDLPQVTLVGVLNADAALSQPDYQATERTFQQLVQVAGRAGRSGTPGRVLIQTRNPDHPAIQFALRQDVDAFAEHELRERREVGYPPYTRIALIRIGAVQEQLAESTASELATLARQASQDAHVRAEVLGPTPAPILKIKNQYRFRFMLRAEARASLRPALWAISRAKVDRRARVSIDIDPVNML